MKQPIKTTTRALLILATTTATTLFLLLLLLLFLLTNNNTTSLHFSSPPPKPKYHSLFLTLSSNSTASRHLRALTARPHIAGSQANFEAADHVRSTFSSHSLVTRTSSSPVLLHFPLQRSLSLLNPQEPQKGRSFELVQETYDGDPYAGVSAGVAPTFHAYAKSGSAAAEVVYVNYGRVEDFEVLKEKGVEVKGKVALARYGKIFRGDIVRNAELSGAVAVVIYTDRAEYGGGKEGKVFPTGRWMPETGVQVGTVYRGVGDPTTPGWGSREGCERRNVEELVGKGFMPGIPSLPVSMRDGEEIHRSIGGPVAEKEWQGGDGEVFYRLGPGPAVLNFSYLGKNEIRTIQNVFGIIEGEKEPDRYVLLGNHRDAWTFGAADPNSGTAALLEVAERLHKLQKRGWRPRRTVILCNWDAEEYSEIGSTEWVEGNKEMLVSKVVAYLNVDVAVVGSGFHAFATPQLDDLIKQATQHVQNPDNLSQTLHEAWLATDVSAKIGRLGGGGSDYVAFLQHVGIPSTDFFFGEDYPVYHSMYDDYVWMEKFGDPMFHRHVAAASVWGLVALKLADEEFLPFNYLSYASELQAKVENLKDDLSGTPLSLKPIYRSIEELKKAAKKIKNDIKALETNSRLSRWSRKDPLKVRELNDRLMMAERAFTNQDGLLGRTWYKHLVYGPSEQDDYSSKSFPGIDDCVRIAKSRSTTDSWLSAQHEIWRVARAVSQAALVLAGEFFS